ncbi:MAG: LysM peptidoglycan-binding domain-containing protein [Bacteroidota bacterium]
METRSTTETVIVEHKVRRGENLYKLAKKYRVTVGQIIRLNELSSARRLSVGEVLRIPKKEVVTSTLHKVAMDNIANPDNELDPTKRTNGRQKLTVKVERGMTLGGMARNFGVTVSDLMTWNKLSSGDRLIAGSTMDVWVKSDAPINRDTSTLAELRTADSPTPVGSSAGNNGSGGGGAGQAVQSLASHTGSGIEAGATVPKFEYTVQHGETLASIAEAFNVTIQNLIEWNELKSTKIRSGSRLTLQTAAIAEASDLSQQQEKPVAKKSGTDKSSATDKSSVTERTSVQEKSAVPEKSAIQKTSPEKAAATRAAQEMNSAQNSSRDSIYTVTKGETLYRIAARHGVSVDQVIEWNGLSEPTIQSGQQIIVQRSAAQTEKTVTVAAQKQRPATKQNVPVNQETSATTESSAKPVSTAKTESPAKTVESSKQQTVTEGESESARVTESGVYTVQPGDNLYQISRATGMSVEDLRKVNKLRSSSIVSGQKLTVVRNPSSIAPKTVQPATAAPKPANESAVDKSAPASAGELRSDAAGTVQQKAVIPEKTAIPVKEATQQKSDAELGRPASAEGGVRHEHIVARGETLNSISRKLGIPVSRLSEWNDLGRFLSIGQKIVYYMTK